MQEKESITGSWCKWEFLALGVIVLAEPRQSQPRVKVNSAPQGWKILSAMVTYCSESFSYYHKF